MVIDDEGKTRLTLIFDSEAESARLDAVRASNADADFWLASGTRQAEGQDGKSPVASIVRGGFGTDDAAIERSIATVSKAGERELRKGKDRISPDLVFCYRVGFRSRCRVAKRAFLSRFVPDSSLSITDLADDPELALARMDGDGAGRRTADDLVRRARDEDLAVLREMVPLLQAAEEVGAKAHEREGMPAAEVVQWRIGFFQGAEPVVQAFLPEAQAVADLGSALVQVADGFSRAKTAAARLGVDISQPAPVNPAPLLIPTANRNDHPRRRLRPEDFGAMPTPPL